MESIYQEIEKEIERSVAKHGEYWHIPLVDQVLLNRGPERMAQEYEIPTASRAQQMTDKATERGDLTHAHIITEELAEVVACMDDLKSMRTELIQLACVAVKAIRSIDHQLR